MPWSYALFLKTLKVRKTQRNLKRHFYAVGTAAVILYYNLFRTNIIWRLMISHVVPLGIIIAYNLGTVQVQCSCVAIASLVNSQGRLPTHYFDL